MKRIIENGIKCTKKILNKVRDVYSLYSFEKREKRLLVNLGLKKDKAPNEDDYEEYWYPVIKNDTPWAFRLYGAFNCYNIKVVAQNAVNIINDILNPKIYRNYLSDKNNFDRYLGAKYFPKTILRKISGKVYLANYKLINEKECINLLNGMLIGSKIVIKPSVNSSSGRGVEIYEKDGSCDFYHLKGSKTTLLDQKRFNIIGDDFIVQEAMAQSDYISQFNTSSINTIRIATYRSVKDDKVHILSSVIRIGKAGSAVDNLHAGGRFVGIDEDGVLGAFSIDQYGTRLSSHNGIDFSKSTYRIPNWGEVQEFAKEVSSKIFHARLVQLDIMLDKENIPHLIEYNINAFSMWIAQFAGSPAFGDYTDEIKQYVIERLNNK